MKDAEGVEIEVGDRILYAALAGRSACLHRGVVTGFKKVKPYWSSDKEITKIQVTIESWGWGGKPGKPKIVYLEFPDRVICVEKPSRNAQPTTKGQEEALPQK